MNRVIKFRGLDSLGNWIYGIPQTSTTIHLNLDCMAQYFTEQRRYGRQNVSVDPKTVGQFTGLKDKNGNEIYEGDIIQDTVVGMKSEVVFTDYANFGLKSKHIKDLEYYNIDPSWSETSCEVVGNIHESQVVIG